MTDDYLANLKKSQQLLALYFGDVGAPCFPENGAIKQRLDQLDDLKQNDFFFVLFDVRNGHFRRVSRNIKKAIGYDELNQQTWIMMMHPNFREIYLQFALAAYNISKDESYQDLLRKKRTSYSINVPMKIKIKNEQQQEREEYWMIKQVSEPLQFDDQGRMVTHLNHCTLVCPMQEYSPTRPYVFFDTESQHLINSQILKKTRQSVLSIFFSNLNNRPKQVLLMFWALYSDFKRGKEVRPTSSMVGKALNLGLNTISDYNRKVLRVAENAFPVSHFSNVINLVEFLHTLFGPIEKDELAP